MDGWASSRGGGRVRCMLAFHMQASYCIVQQSKNRLSEFESLMI